MNITEMTLEDLESLKEQVLDSLACRRKQEKEKTHQALVVEKAKKIASRYHKARKRLEAAATKSEVTVVLPIKFTLNNTIQYQLDSQDGCYRIDSEDFFEQKVSGKILNNTEGVSRKQRVVLQEGLRMLIDEACEKVNQLFPDYKEIEEAVAEFNSVMEEAQGLKHGDFDAFE